MRDFKETDLFKIDFRDEELENELKIKGCIEGLLNLAKVEDFYTIEKKGVILCVGGFYKVYKGVYASFILPSRTFKDNSVHCFKSIKKKIDWFFNSNSCHRLETKTYTDDIHENFLRHLGFEKEGVLRQFMWNKNDMTIWSIIK